MIGIGSRGPRGRRRGGVIVILNIGLISIILIALVIAFYNIDIIIDVELRLIIITQNNESV